MAKFGEMYEANIYFKGTTGPYKKRPVLIIDDSEAGLITIAEITSVGPKSPPTYHDSFKVEVTGWQASGLDELSWVKCFKGNVHRVPEDKVFNYRGIAEDDLMINVLNKVVNQ